MDDKAFRFLKSALQVNGVFISNEKVLEWISRRNQEVNVSIDFMSLSEMKDWRLDDVKGCVRHSTGKFFSIDGINVKTNYGLKTEWEQPIINQPEVGILGCLVKEIQGVLHFLVQAKIEPGNVNNVQLSPTLQATKSNYSRVHNGKSPTYLEYFNGDRPHKVLLDQLQSEQGARFLHKRNRNIIVEISEELPYNPDFVWLTLGQIKWLAQMDNIVNMDLRTVISGLNFGELESGTLELLGKLAHSSSYTIGMLSSALESARSLYSMEDIISWFTSQKVKYSLEVERKDLRHIMDWHIYDDRITHRNSLYFDVRFVNVHIANREVSEWQQPIIVPRENGILAFIVRKINGVYHFLVQAKLECGNFDTLEFAPTVQCITGSYTNTHSFVPYLDYILNAHQGQIRLDVLQSEEGGRFYHEQNRNMIVEAASDFPIETPESFCWMTLHQLLTFIRYNNYLNIQARSLLSAICLNA